MSENMIRVATLKRCAPEGNKKKRAINKRPKTLGPSIGATVIVTRSGIPRVTIVGLRNADPSDEEVKVVLAPSTILAPLATISASRVVAKVSRWASTVPGAAMAPSSSLILRAFGGSSA